MIAMDHESGKQTVQCHTPAHDKVDTDRQCMQVCDYIEENKLSITANKPISKKIHIPLFSFDPPSYHSLENIIKLGLLDTDTWYTMEFYSPNPPLSHIFSTVLII